MRDVAHDAGDFAFATEQHHDNGKHDQPMPKRKATHSTFSQSQS
jgi:hypothetical protein